MISVRRTVVQQHPSLHGPGQGESNFIGRRLSGKSAAHVHQVDTRRPRYTWNLHNRRTFRQYRHVNIHLHNK